MMISSMIIIKNNFRVLWITHGIMVCGFILSAMATLLYLEEKISMFSWTTAVGLGLYMVYIPFNSLLFDRLLAAFRFAGTVGFLIYIADSFGYLASVAVLISKSIFKLQMHWLHFYENLVLTMAVVGILGSFFSRLGKITSRNFCSDSIFSRRREFCRANRRQPEQWPGAPGQSETDCCVVLCANGRQLCARRKRPWV